MRWITGRLTQKCLCLLTFYFESATWRSTDRFTNHSSHLRRKINVIQKSEVGSKSFEARHHHSVTDFRLATLESAGLNHVKRHIHTHSIISTFASRLLWQQPILITYLFICLQPVKITFTVVICATELGHVGRRSACVCHVNPPFDAYFHIRRSMQRKATATVVPPSRDPWTTFCTYKKQQSRGRKVSATPCDSNHFLWAVYQADVWDKSSMFREHSNRLTALFSTLWRLAWL